MKDTKPIIDLQAGVAVKTVRLRVVIAAMLLTASPAVADRIENQLAIFSALDKVTARISKFEAPLGQTKTFGALKVTPRACYSRPSTEQPKTTTFVEVDEVQLDGTEKRIFTGWMFAESPGLYGVEHPTFDVWLTECQKPLKAMAQKAIGAAAKPAAGANNAAKDAATGADTAEPQSDGGGAPQEPHRRVRR